MWKSCRKGPRVLILDKKFYQQGFFKTVPDRDKQTGMILPVAAKELDGACEVEPWDCFFC